MTSSGRPFQICGPRLLILLPQNLTVFRFGISKLFFLFFDASRLAKRFFINAGFRSFSVLKDSRANVLGLLISIVHYFFPVNIFDFAQ